MLMYGTLTRPLTGMNRQINRHTEWKTKTTFILHLRSTVARVEAGAEILLLDA